MALDPSINRYVSLVDSIPALLANSQGEGLTEADIAPCRERIRCATKIYCELGSGSGGHLIECAARDPEALFVGFELRYKRAYRTAEKALQRNLSNIFVFRANALELTRVFRQGELDGVYVNFPDPWDRKKWKKHRLLNPGMLHTLHQLLSPGGFISYKSDHKGYFFDTMELLQEQFFASGLFRMRAYSEDFHCSGYADGSPRSEFEKLFKSKGCPVYYVKIEKIGNSPINPV